MTRGKEPTVEAGQEPGESVTINLPWIASHGGMPVHEAVLRFIPAGKAIYLLPVALFLFSLFFGRYMMDPVETFRILVIGSVNAFFDGASSLLSAASGQQVLLPSFEQTWGASEQTVVFQIRLPRLIAAMLVGGGLAIAGASFQGLFRNPLVSPDILGVSAGAGFGAALGILLSGNPWVIQVSAFFFGILAVAVTYGIGRAIGKGSTLVLVLGGIIVGSLFSAFISLTKYVADPYDTLPAIVFWLMGSLSAVSNADIVAVAPPILLGALCLYLVRWRINLLAVGEEEAQALGLDTKRMTVVLIIASTVITASAVCISGIIGWVGLVVPHIGRMLVGPDFRKLIPVSAVIGASFILIVDDIARTLTVAEIPLGILTSLIGAPFFAYLLTRKKVGWIS
ncbi:FecCD family ABC transporter permease [Methanoculleus sp. UBA303]|jgi:iron complex transport system permease protein|uniref:FecCD family ABC transporter permease n=1 Tax=Methanoculleus sp. UBA303 TaxID=1915497 RepID=UPI0025E81BAE|nr:iron ABC transporter permease [Methanoculleus sp. UBA303]